MSSALVLVALVACAALASALSSAPEQIHLAITGNPGERIVSWVTMAQTNASYVQYGNSLAALTQQANSDETAYVTALNGTRTIYLHDALLVGLTVNTRYYYRVGNAVSGWSAVYDFDTKIDVPNTPVDIIVYGDMGSTNSDRTISKLKSELAGGFSSLILHTGDFAYDLHDHDGIVGDEFMNMIQPVAAYVPYMVCVGNHEYDGRNFSQYQNRFAAVGRYSQSGTNNNLYYSFNVNYVHFTIFSSELYYSDDTAVIAEQYAWLQKDLAQAVANRDKQPWIIAVAHRPIYCSNVDDVPDCTKDVLVMRDGPYSLDNLFAQYKVDMFIGAHEHSYELTWPVSHSMYQLFPNPNVYVNPLYTVNIVAGSAGCKEDLDYYDKIYYGPWSNFRSASYGYAHLIAYNHTHLYWAQKLNEGDQGVNELWMIKGNATEVADHAHNFGYAPSPMRSDACEEYCFVACVGNAVRNGQSTQEAHASCGATCNCVDRVAAGQAELIGTDVRVELGRVTRH